MASVVGAASAAADNVALPTHKAGDLIIVSAFRANSSAPSKPSVATGWQSIQSLGADALGLTTGYLRALKAGHVSGTWTNATQIGAVILRPGVVDPFPATSTPLNTTLLDDFNRADGNIIAGGAWAAGGLRDATASNLGITSNGLVRKNAGAWDQALGAATLGPDLDLQLDCVAPPLTGTSGMRIYFAMQNVQNAAMTGWGINLDYVGGTPTWRIFRQLSSTSYEVMATIVRPMPAAGDQVWASVRDSQIAFYHKPSGGSWTLIIKYNDFTGSVAKTGRYGVEVGGGTNSQKWDNLRGGTVSTALVPLELEVVGSSSGNAASTTNIAYPALTVTKVDGTSVGVRTGSRTVADAAVGNTPSGIWTNQIIQPAGAAALMSMHAMDKLVNNIITNTPAAGATPAPYRAHTIEVNERTTPVPTWEDSIDTFDRADGAIYTGAVGSRIWNASFVNSNSNTYAKIASNRLSGGVAGISEAHTRASLGASCDIIIDNVVALGVGSYFYFFWALANPGSTAATGWVLRMRYSTATTDDWAMGFLINGDYDNNMYVYYNDAPKLPVGGSIWVAKRGQIQTAYKRDTPTGPWLRVFTFSNSQNDRAGTIGISTMDSTSRWDNLRGGPLTWPPEYYPNQQTMMM